MTSSADRALSVLWATDGSESARNAVPLLKSLLRAGAGVTVLVIAPHAMISGARPDPALLSGFTRTGRQRALDAAHQLAEQEAALLGGGASVDVAVRWGGAIEEILRAAKARRPDMILLGAKGHTNLALLVLGSVAQGVVQLSTRPVLLVRPGAERLEHVVVAYDDTVPARKALRFVARLDLPKPAVTLVRVIEPFTVPNGLPVAYRRQAIAAAREINEELHASAHKSLETVAAKLRKEGYAVETEVAGGVPAREIDRLAAAHSADLIVVGSRGPSVADHYLLGSTAEKLVRHAHTSVLVVR